MNLRIINNTPPIEFYNGPHKQMIFTLCNEEELNNPLLNRLYKENVCYTERWYLESRKLIAVKIKSNKNIGKIMKSFF